MQQAGTDTSGKWMGVDHAEKFAELIVRECVDVCNSCSQWAGSDGISKEIKEHFGVEE
jgi:hypothetical protein